MSCVTDLVFIIPWALGSERSYRERFERSFHEAHGWEIHPQEGTGRAMLAAVYSAGVNYIDLQWVGAVLAGDWPQGTVLWLHPEEDGSDVGQPVMHQLSPKERQ